MLSSVFKLSVVGFGLGWTVSLLWVFVL